VRQGEGSSEPIGCDIPLCGHGSPREEKEQDEVVEFLDSITEQWGFPVLLIHNKYMLCGYKEQATRKLLGFDETESQKGKEATEWTAEDPDVEKAYERLQRFSEKKGYFLNPDAAFVLGLPL
jgi:hypothetical protein